jgi:thiol-disulfide isomerase/thioredoxin
MTQWILLAVLLLTATAFGVYRQKTDGKAKVVDTREMIAATDINEELGERATLLQFSSAFCAPCRATRVVLSKTAEALPGVKHVEIDAESHLELVRRLDIRRTPTTLILDKNGRVNNRAAGVPNGEELLAAIAATIESAN